MWLQDFAERHLLGSVWLVEPLRLQAWRTIFEAGLDGVRAQRRSRPVRVPPMSREWLRQHEVDSAKHARLI